MLPFEFHQEFDTHIRKIFCLMAAVSQSDKVVNGIIQKQRLAICSIFGGSRLSGDNNSSLSVPHDKFSIHAYINHLHRMLFPGGRINQEDRRAWHIPQW